MAIITVDFETFYSKDYSLRRMSTAEYILDPRFQVIMATIKVNDGDTQVALGHEEVGRRLRAIDWSRNAMLAHHTHFDGAIMAWVYGIIPRMYLCTLSMARATTHAVIGRSSLEKVSDYLGLPPKGREVHNALGKRYEDFRPNELLDYAAYCARDTDNCKTIFNRLKPLFPASELDLIDTIVRLYTEPQVLLDSHVLSEHLHALAAEKAAVMGQVAHLDPAVFSSNPKFAALLESYGVTVPRKVSPTTGEETWALAKNDRAFKELCEDDSQPTVVQVLLAARVHTKSTIEETRTQKMLANSLRSWQGKGVGIAPVPLKYWGAHTGRLSGDGGENWQNFKRGSAIRKAIKAPPGYRIVHRDASQIEARMVSWLARCWKLVQAFAEGRDVYSEFASIIYGRRVTKGDKLERFVGKTGILGLGYQCGWEKFRHMLFIGNGGVSVKVDEKTAKKIVYDDYRKTYPEIPWLWELAQNLLSEMVEMSAPLDGGQRHLYARAAAYVDQLKHFPVVEPGFDALWLPNGMALQYPGIRVDTDPSNGRRGPVCNDTYGGMKHLYGGIVTENVSQALARIVVTDISTRVKRDTGYHPFLTTHDSLDYCVPENQAREMDARLEYEFSVRPSWAPDLPLASEGGYGRTLFIAENDKDPEHNQ